MGLLDFFNRKESISKLDVVKEMSAESRRVMRAYSRFIGSNLPVWKETNTQNYVEYGYNQNYLVYSIVQWKAQKSAQVDFRVCRKLPGGEKEVIKDHEALEVIYKPNDWQGKQEFFEQFYGFKFIDGNSYIYAPKIENGPNKGKITEMHVLPAPLTEIVTGTNFNPVGGYRVEMSPDLKDFQADDVIHCRYANYDFEDTNWLYGISPLQATWRLIQKSNSNQEAAKKSFDNMGALGLLYQKDKELASMLTDEKRKAAQNQLDKKIRGTDNKGRIVWSVGDYGYLNFGADPVDLALIDDEKMTRDQICTAFHVQPVLFGNSDSATYNNMQEARKITYVDGILPEVQGFVDEWNRHIMPAYGEDLYLEIVRDNIPELQPDRAKQADWLSKSAWLTENEKRKIMDFEPLPGLDVNFYSAGLLPMGEDAPEPDIDKALRAYKKE